MTQRWTAWALMLLTLFGGETQAKSPVTAPRRLALTLAFECPGLKARELARLLAIETADLPDAKLERLVLMVKCGAEETRLVLSNPDTRRQMERVLPVTEAARQGAEREIALTASRLLINSWLELFTDAPPEVKPPDPPPPQTIYVEVEKSRELDLAVHGGVAVRDLAAPFAMYGGGLRLGIGLAERLRLVVELDFDAGVATREVGRVNAMLVKAGGGVLYALIRAGAFTLDAGVLAFGQYGRLEGTAVRAAYTGSSLSGFAGDASVTVAPALRFGVFSVGLEVSAGYSFPAMEGRVAGSSAVTLSGLWAAASLMAEVSF